MQSIKQLNDRLCVYELYELSIHVYMTVQGSADHLLSKWEKIDLFFSFLSAALPVRGTPPTPLLLSPATLLFAPSHCPSRCRPPPCPYQSQLPDPSGLHVQVSPFSLSLHGSIVACGDELRRSGLRDPCHSPPLACTCRRGTCPGAEKPARRRCR
jgi:hypothetical protein